MPRLQRIEKVSHVILMVGLIGLADLGHAARPQMVLICGLREIFEWLVMRNVVSYRRHEVVPSQSCMVSAAHRAAHRIYASWRESALKPTPRNALGIQQIANVFPGYSDHVRGLQFGVRHHAIIKARPRIAYDRTGREPIENIPVGTRGGSVRS